MITGGKTKVKKIPELGKIGRKRNNLDISSIIGSTMQLKHVDISGAENILIAGEIEGDLEIDGYAVISDTGNVRGTIYAKNITISGTFKGDIYAEELLICTATAKVYGRIQTGNMVVDSGAKIEAICDTGVTPEKHQATGKISVTIWPAMEQTPLDASRM